MPGMPIFQDSPSQLKGQIYVVDSTTSNVVPLQVDATGSLSTTFATGSEVSLAAGTTVGLASGTTVGLASGATVGLAAGAEVALAAGTDIDTVTAVTTVGTVTNDVKIVNGSTGLTVGLAAGTDIDTVTTVGTVTNDVKIVNGSTGLTVGLAAGTNEIGTVGLAAGTNSIGTVGLTSGTTVGLAAGTNAIGNVGLSAGTNLIGKVENQLVFTNLDSFGAATPLTSQAVGAGATVNATSRDISLETSYNWFIKNTGTAANQNITLKVELSPDGTNWLEDTGTTISVTFGQSKMITVTNFLKYARFVITGGAAATTVISCFQAQH